jgi:GTP-binding protein
MRFIDEHTITVSSGRGGRGSSSFRRESKVPMGGPDGGDGGRGGHVVLMADPQLTSLLDIRHLPLLKADDGEAGGKKQMTGANGKNLVIRLPPGTLVYDAETGVQLLDLSVHYEERVIAEGGKGGLGNVHFKTSTNRSPRKTTPGGPGTVLKLKLELRVMADVGLLGFPNAGKSTLISVVSAARPLVADYPFTTLTPHLGVVDLGLFARGGRSSFVVADIPGIIEGAAEGKGLGHQFLRHVSRTRLLLHLVSLQSGDHGETHLSPGARYRILRDELKRYDSDLVKRPEIVVLTKADLGEPAILNQAISELQQAGVPEVRVISAVTRQGIPELVREVAQKLSELPIEPAGSI